MSKKHIFILSFVFLAISQVILPAFNNSQDFLFLTPWNMFSGYSSSAKDITWDEGRTYLLRDHRVEAKRAGINIQSLLLSIYTSDVNSIVSQHKDQITQFCKCQGLFLHEQNINLYEHIMQKKVGQTLSMIEL